MPAAQSAHAGISAGHVLPQLRPTRPTPPRGVLSPPRAAQRQAPAYRLSDANAVQCTGIVKTLLYFWTAVATLVGLILPCFVLYLMYFRDGGNLLPSLPHKLAAYSSLGVAVACGLGLYGLVKHRECVSKGSRNYGLGMFVVLGAIAAIVLLVAGAMSLSFVRVVELAEEDDFSSERAVYLETTMLTRLHAQVRKSSSDWRDTQNALNCCGYEAVAAMQANVQSSSDWDPSLVTAVRDANSVGSKYCSSRASECSDAYCPVATREWCRTELLQVAHSSFSLLGICAVVLGSAQLFFSAMGLFTLLCDVRRQSGLSPTIQIQHHALSSIQPSSASNAQQE